MNEIIDFSHTDPTTSTIYSTRPGHLIADHRHSQSAARVIVADDDDDVVTTHQYSKCGLLQFFACKWKSCALCDKVRHLHSSGIIAWLAARPPHIYNVFPFKYGRWL